MRDRDLVLTLGLLGAGTVTGLVIARSSTTPASAPTASAPLPTSGWVAAPVESSTSTSNVEPATSTAAVGSDALAPSEPRERTEQERRRRAENERRQRAERERRERERREGEERRRRRPF